MSRLTYDVNTSLLVWATQVFLWKAAGKGSASVAVKQANSRKGKIVFGTPEKFCSKGHRHDRLEHHYSSKPQTAYHPSRQFSPL
jgi:hypothetical protein